MKVFPNKSGSGYSFENKVTGGAIPREYIEPVNQGVQGALQSGILAGYEIVDIGVSLYDGSYHEVDSSEMAFKLAGSMALKDAMKKGGAVLLEPYMKVEVVVPSEYLGDVMGDINSRRGKLEGMEEANGAQVIRAFVPLSEMFGYATDLRSKSQGRGVHTMQFNHYEEVPKNIAEKIMGTK